MSDKRHWIWFQLCLGVAKNFEPLLQEFGSIEKIYNANYLQRKCSDLITDKVLERMEKITLEDADKVIDQCNENYWQIITFEDEAYPNKLKNISCPPAVLYVSGQLPDLNDNLTIGVVGTRKASPYAITSAKLLSKGIARCGGIVVSGGARGVDSASHIGTLDANGTTVAVLGCGLASSYIEYNLDLKEMIKSTGAIITEYPPKTIASKFTFPQRNRIISGLCDGVLVVEASVKSGSLITASYATAQNRDLFAVPCSILDFKFEGTRKLIADGAIVATDVSAIVGCYKEKYKSLDFSKVASNEELLYDEYKERDISPADDEQITFERLDEHRKNKGELNEKADNLSGNQKLVFDVLKDDFLEIDIIAKNCTLDIKDVLTSLTMLELDGLVEAGVGKRYKIKST